MATDPIVVVGASLAGVSAARAIRRADDEIGLVIVGDEPHRPYDRPPLSKGFLAGSVSEDALELRAAKELERADWRLGVRAVSVDTGRRTVGLDDGTSLSYRGLVVATGARPRTLPDAAFPGVHVLRNLDDGRAIKEAIAQRPARVVVIGAGFIGAEVAATIREAGVDVTLVEMADAPLGRVLDHDAGMAIAELHRRHGVDVRLGVGVENVVASSGGGVSAVDLTDGSSVGCDMVVVGIGVVPNTEWLESSGLPIDDGIVCDATCLAASGVVAAGDVARWVHPRFGHIRIEQWDNGVEQGAYAGRRLLADVADTECPDPYEPVPWFWSDQYDRKIQLAGVPGPTSEIVHGSIDEQRFVQLYTNEASEPVGVLAWNRPRHAVQARQLLADGASVEDLRTALG